MPLWDPTDHKLRLHGIAAVSRRAVPPEADIVFIVVGVAIWLALVTVFLLVWSAHHARARWLHGIDELQYINAEDDESLRDQGLLEAA